MRGGIEKLTIATEAAETIEMKIYLLWIKPQTTFIAGATIDKGVDPVINASDTTDQSAKVIKTWAFNLERDSAMTIERKPRVAMIDPVEYANGSGCLWWYIGVANTVTNSAVTVTFVHYYNCSVTANVTA